MKRLALPLLALLLLTAPAARASDDRPYDVLLRHYAPYCTPGDDLAFPMKIWGLSRDQHSFWRGSRELYFAWCRTNARDWLADPGAYVLTHGDLHLGNIGTYARAGQLGATDFGPVDFDETARLPFQLELLQGLIAIRLAARENDIDLSGRREELARDLFTAYRDAVASGRTTRELVTPERNIGRFIEQARRHTYDKTLNKFTDDNGQFLKYVNTRKSLAHGLAPKEILRPAMDQADALARGLSDALARSPAATAAFRYTDQPTIRRSIKDVSLRTRLESVGSQGLKKYLVLLDKPLRGMDMDVVMYVKQEIPSAAERAGAIPPDPRSPGQRCSEDMDRLTNPTAFLNCWCDIGHESYWVTFKEPWSDDLEPEMAKDYPSLRMLARVWGKVAGSMHGSQPGRRADILQRLDRPGATDLIRHRSTLYMAALDRQYDDFTTDPRPRATAAKAQAIIDTAKREATAQARR
jgi:uncharacterized protein (DUF2252 family)